MTGSKRGQRFARRFTSMHAYGAASRRAPEDRFEKFPKIVFAEENDPATHFQISPLFERIWILMPMQFTRRLRFFRKDNSYAREKRKSVVTVFRLGVLVSVRATVAEKYSNDMRYPMYIPVLRKLPTAYAHTRYTMYMTHSPRIAMSAY